MVSIASLTQTSNRKLTTLFNSPVSSSLRMEVLITNLLVAIERGEFKDLAEDSDDEVDSKPLIMDEDEENADLGASHDNDEDDPTMEEQDNDGMWQAARSLKRKASHVGSYETFADDDPIFAEDEDELDHNSDDVPSPLFDHFDEEDSDDLVPSSTSPNKIPSRRVSSPTDLKKHKKSRSGGNLHLEDIEIEVVDDHWLSKDPQPRDNYIAAEEPSASSPQKSPLVIRIKVPTHNGSDADLSSPQKKRKREVGHDEQSFPEELAEDGDQREDVRSSLKALLASPKKKLKPLCEEREISRAQ